MKYGLVMEGGAMRGLFTAGVTDVLMENGITFDGAVGTSAGAAFGCNYKSGQNGRTIRYNLRFCKDKRYCSFFSLITTGDVFGADFCYHEMPEKLDIFDSETFEKNPMEFYTVSTDIMTGKAVYHRMSRINDTELEWLRSSASLPVFSRIVKINDKKLLDGSISDSIPLRFMNAIGYEKNIVILTQPRGFVKTQSRMFPIAKMMYRKYPDFVRAIERRPKMYNSQLEYVRQSEAEGKTLVIAPPHKLSIGHTEHEQEKMLEVYRTGRKTATEMIDRIIAFLDRNAL